MYVNVVMFTHYKKLCKWIEEGNVIFIKLTYVP